jgi:hypothetical protein
MFSKKKLPIIPASGGENDFYEFINDSIYSAGDYK